MSLLDKLKKNSTIKDTAILSKSIFFAAKDMIQTSIPVVNVAFSGDLDGGFTPGLTMWAGPSKHFKTAFSLLMAKAYQDKYPGSVVLFYDSEFGTPQNYFTSFGIDMERVVHTPVTDVEQLKFDIMNQLQNIERGERVMIVIDSIGNLASKKEVEDALEQKSVGDMTRAKQIKSLFRMVTPHLTLKDIPMVVVNHTYKEIGLYPKDIVGGGTGSYYSADNIYILGRQQEKDGADLIGYNFIINVEKSRYVREKAKIPVTVRFDGGISHYSGLLDMALESGHVTKPNVGWYAKVNTTTGEVESKKWRLADTECADFWASIMADPTFKEWVRNNYQFSAAMSNTVTEVEDDGQE
jgi:RecA/RadA recombinase